MQAVTLLNMLAIASATSSRPPPIVPSVGAVASGSYRNVFVEAGYTSADVDSRLNQTLQQLFFGNPTNESLLYPATDGSNASYIWSTSSNDVRTEGMSYGLMAAVQLDLQVVFDRLLSWWTRFMQHTQESVRRKRWDGLPYDMGTQTGLHLAPSSHRIRDSATRLGTVKPAVEAWTQTRRPMERLSL